MIGEEMMAKTMVAKIWWRRYGGGMTGERNGRD